MPRLDRQNRDDHRRVSLVSFVVKILTISWHSTEIGPSLHFCFGQCVTCDTIGRWENPQLIRILI